MNTFVRDKFPIFLSWMSRFHRVGKGGVLLSQELYKEISKEMLRMFEYAEALSFDELTGMLVRKLFFIELTQAVRPFVSAVFRGDNIISSRIVCLVGDVAMLSYANSKGHLVGDKLLRAIARIMHSVKSLMSFGRAGGDEIAGFSTDVDPELVKAEAREAQIRIASVPCRQLDVGVSTLTDVVELLALTADDGNPLVSAVKARSKTKFVVDTLFAVAMERAQISKIAFRLAFLARIFVEDKELFLEVKPHAIKSTGGATTRIILSLSKKLSKGVDIWPECYRRALTSRQKEMGDTPYQLAVFIIAVRAFQ